MYEMLWRISNQRMFKSIQLSQLFNSNLRWSNPFFIFCDPVQIKVNYKDTMININFRVILVTQQISRKSRLPATQWNQPPSAANNNPSRIAVCRQHSPPPPNETNHRLLLPVASETNCCLLLTKSSNTRGKKIHHYLPPLMESIATCGQQNSTTHYHLPPT